MANDVYTAALERLAVLRQEQRELETFIATYNKLAASAGGDEQVRPSGARDEATRPRRRRGTVTEQLVSAACEVIAANNAPMKLGDIYKAVVARGIVIGGRNPTNNLGAKLSADPRLETRPGLGWWFKDEPIPQPAGSYPREREQEHHRHSEGPEVVTSEPSQVNGAAVQAA